MGDEIVADLSTKLNELYREAQLSQIEDNLAVKSNVVAEKHLKKGIEHFCSGKFEKAKGSYTICLAYAEEDSEVIGHAYANRSAVLFKLGHFEQCLLDIDRALNSNYPEDKKKSLHGRKKQASKLMVNQSPALAISRTSEVEEEWRGKLCDFHNPCIPGASYKIKIENNEKWGRHLIATRDIDAGDILTCQKYFVMAKQDDSHIEYHICSYCLLHHPAPIPCPSCTAVYCSEHCRTEAFNSYHRIACRLFKIKDVHEYNVDVHDFIALRCLLVGTDQGAGLASLTKEISLQEIVGGEVRIDEFIDEPISGDYVDLLRLLRKFVKPQFNKVGFIPRIIIALQKAGYFDNVPDGLKTYLTEMELYASFLLLNHRQTIDHATFALTKFNDLNPLQTRYGLGVCILHAMLNHSCDPNVDFITRSQEMALYALKPIPKGGQLFISYTTYSFAYNSQPKRQKIMSYPSSKFQFNCECEACVNNWPIYDDLLKLPRKFLDPDISMALKTIIRSVASLVTEKTADSTSRFEIIWVISQLCNFLHIYVERPSAASALCEQVLIRAMKQFYDTSSPSELTELRKKEIFKRLLSKIVRISNIMQYLPT